MLGAFGVLLATQFALPAETRDIPRIAKRILSLANILTGIGLLAGFGLYFLTIKIANLPDAAPLGENLHLAIGMKFMILLAVGACLGMGYPMVRKGNVEGANTLRWIALALMATAAAIASIL